MKAETNFSQDWFSRSIPAWSAILSQLAKVRQPLRILEVGVFEGRSTCWLLENYCRSADDVIVAVDDFSGGNFPGRSSGMTPIPVRCGKNSRAT